MTDIEEVIVRAWDAEESAQMGEPSPWSIPPDAEWIADRLGCAKAVIAALEAAGFVIIPNTATVAKILDEYDRMIASAPGRKS